MVHTQSAVTNVARPDLEFMCIERTRQRSSPGHRGIITQSGMQHAFHANDRLFVVIRSLLHVLDGLHAHLLRLFLAQLTHVASSLPSPHLCLNADSGSFLQPHTLTSVNTRPIIMSRMSATDTVKSRHTAEEVERERDRHTHTDIQTEARGRAKPLHKKRTCWDS